MAGTALHWVQLRGGVSLTEEIFSLQLPFIKVFTEEYILIYLRIKLDKSPLNYVHAQTV